MLLETGIGLGLQGLSTALGFSSDRKQRKLAAANLKQAQGQFDSQMDESIQRRMVDAKKAGIHPLFAMGASAGASPTITAGGTEPAPNQGQRGIESLAASLGVIGTNRAQAARDEAEAQLALAEAAQIRQDMYSQGRDKTPDSVRTYPMGLRPGPGLYDIERPIVPESKAAGVRAGPIPENIQITDKNGRQMYVLNPDAGLDEIAQVDYIWQKMGLNREDQKKGYGETLYGGYDKAKMKMEARRLRDEKAKYGLNTALKYLAKRLYQYYRSRKQ